MSSPDRISTTIFVKWKRRDREREASRETEQAGGFTGLHQFSLPDVSIKNGVLIIEVVTIHKWVGEMQLEDIIVIIIILMDNTIH